MTCLSVLHIQVTESASDLPSGSSPTHLGPSNLPLLVPCMEHLAELGRQEVDSKLRHRKASSTAPLVLWIPVPLLLSAWRSLWECVLFTSKN